MWFPSELLTFCSISGLLIPNWTVRVPLLRVTTSVQKLSCYVSPGVLISAWNQLEGPQNMFYSP